MFFTNKKNSVPVFSTVSPPLGFQPLLPSLLQKLQPLLLQRQKRQNKQRLQEQNRGERKWLRQTALFRKLVVARAYRPVLDEPKPNKSWSLKKTNLIGQRRKILNERVVERLKTKAQLSPSKAPLPTFNKKNRVIVITSGKGGVGKTSVTANIGTSIARLGYPTVLIDADIGLKNLDLLVGLENRIMYTIMDVFENRCSLDQALTRDKRWKNLSLLSISKNRQRYNITRKNMQSIVQALINKGYEYILIDCPAGIDVGFINAISPANEAIIVTTPELPALRDADRVAGLLEANGILDIKLLVNRVRPDLVSSHNMLSVKDVQEALGISLLGAVPEDLEIILSTNFGEPLVLRKKLTLAGIALETVARRLVGYKTDFLNLETPYKNVFQKALNFLVRPFN